MSKQKYSKYKPLKNIQASINRVIFYFPPQNWKLKKFSIFKQFEILLNQNNKLIKFKRVKNNLNNNYYFCTHKGCPARFIFALDKFSQSYKLKGLNNLHKHHLQNDHLRQEKQILEYSKKNSALFIDNEQRNIIQKKFQINKKRYDYIKKKSQKIINFKQIINEIILSEFNYQYNQNQLIIFNNKFMIESSKKYGDIIRYHEYQLDYTSINYKNYSIGIFLGIDFSMHPIILAFAIFQSNSNFFSIMLMFLKLTKTKPETIILDLEQRLISAIISLNQLQILPVNYILNPINFLNKIQISLINKQNLILFERLIKQTSLIKYQHLIKTVKERQQLALQYYQNIKTNLSLFYLKSILGPTNCFINFMKIEFIIKNKIEKVSVTKIIKILKSMSQNLMDRKIYLQKYNMEKLFQDQYLGQVRTRTTSNIFNIFMKEYIQARYLDLKQLSQLQITNDSKYFCSCLYQTRTGFPCRHLIYVLHDLHLSYLSKIRSRWIINQELLKKNNINEQSSQ